MPKDSSSAYKGIMTNWPHHSIGTGNFVEVWRETVQNFEERGIREKYFRRRHRSRRRKRFSQPLEGLEVAEQLVRKLLH
jgi:hypothetical protein